jgi:hypothetical protein
VIDSINATGTLALFGTLTVNNLFNAPAGAILEFATPQAATDRFTNYGTQREPTFTFNHINTHRLVIGASGMYLMPTPAVLNASLSLNPGESGSIDISDYDTTYAGGATITKIGSTDLALFSGTLPSGAALSVSGTVINYTPSSGSYTADNVQYTFGDDSSDLNGPGVATGTITVAINRPPTLNSIPDQTVAVGTTGTIQVNSTDPNTTAYGNQHAPETASYSIISEPSWVSAGIDTNGLLSITPSAGPLSGTMTVQVTDSGGLTDTKTFNIRSQGIPVVTVTDPGGTYDGRTTFPGSAIVADASGSPSGTSLEGVEPTFSCYDSNMAPLNPVTGPPSAGGQYYVQAHFPGSTNYTSADSSMVSFTVETAATTVSLSSDANPCQNMETGGIEATVTSTAIGTIGGCVEFYIGGGIYAIEPVVNGVALLPFSLLAVGSYDFTAYYIGDSNFSPAWGSQDLVQVVNPNPTTVALTASATSFSNSGGSITLTATISYNSASLLESLPTGSVFFQGLGWADVQNGVATIVVNGSSGYSPGQYSIDAYYAGDSVFDGSPWSNWLDFTVTA